ncbi:hypothetical protein GJ496_001173 [Pomphorhynchus laevis]|nr:hypothetical protein GJ496_001173 [Pomphorhynchus laevis]
MKHSHFSAYYVVKHSWKGKYTRLFLIGTEFIQTLNPTNLQVTNEWAYNDLTDVSTSTDKTYEFTLISKRKDQNVRFSCTYRSELLTDLHSRWIRSSPNTNIIKCEKFTWQCKWIPKLFQITRHGIIVYQSDESSSEVQIVDDHVSVYNYVDIKEIHLQNHTCCIGIQLMNLVRLHMFRFRNTNEANQVCQMMSDNISRSIGQLLPKIQNCKNIESYFLLKRFSQPYDSDISKTSLLEFTVSRRKKQRLLCITSNCLIERDAVSYRICSLIPLNSIHMICRSLNDERFFQVLLASSASGKAKSYSCTCRDDILVGLLDAVKAAGNFDVYVQSNILERGFRFSPLSADTDGDLQINLIRMLEKPALRSFKVFCANVNYHTGSKSFDDQTKYVSNALNSILNLSLSGVDVDFSESCLCVLKRLLSLPIGCDQFSKNSTIRDGLGRIVKHAVEQCSAVAYAAIEVLNMLMQPTAQQSSASGQDLLREQRNKRYLLQSERFVGGLLDLLAKHVRDGTSGLLIMSILDFFTLAVCPPFSETTDGSYFDQTLTLLAAKAGHLLYEIIDRPNSLTLRRGSSMLIQALIEESCQSVSRQMCELSLTNASFMSNILTALFGGTSYNVSSKNLSFQTKNTITGKTIMRKLSRNLLELWTSDGKSGPAFDLLSRCLPLGLLQYLLKTDQFPPPGSDQHFIDNYDDDLVTSKSGVDNPFDRNNLKLLIDADDLKEKNNTILKNIEHELTKILSHWRLNLNAIKQKSPKFSNDNRNDDNNDNDVVVLRRRRAKLRKDYLNWPLFYYQFYQDHCKPDLIWNFYTRQELKQHLQNEYDHFCEELEKSASTSLICWNHQEFLVPYNCLNNELRVGNYYLRLLISMEDCGGISFSNNTEQVLVENLYDAFVEPADFFSQLYHRFLLAPEHSQMRYACIRALSLVYSKCFTFIGSFNDIKFIFSRLKQSSCGDRKERDLLIEFVDSLSLQRKNAPAIIKYNGIQVLIDLLPLAHLHTDRPRLVGVVANTDMIEAPKSPQDSDVYSSEINAQWFYLDSSNTKYGPVTAKELIAKYIEGQINRRSQIWASGMYAWRPMERVGQFFWTQIVKCESLDSTDDEDPDFNIECDIPWYIQNETDLARLILRILTNLSNEYPSRNKRGAILKPLPRITSILSSASNLSTLVQLFLTFDPTITEYVASLLCSIMDDNPIVSTLYETGCFFFILMYQGSNLLPIARLLHKTHKIQATRIFQLNSSAISDSILSPMLPAALVFFLEQLWARKICSGFRERMQNTGSHLEYFAKAISCSTYIRTSIRLHWPIPDPLQLLKDCIRKWKGEMEIKPPDLSLESACLVLELTVDLSDANVLRNPDLAREVRQAYFRLAHKYHPDKNPGIDRGLFEQVSDAYEILMDHLENNRTEQNQADSHEHNIYVLIATQVYIYKRFNKQLSEYRYPGYGLLVKILERYTDDSGHCDLFTLSLSSNKKRSTLPTTIELCVETVNCSPLNAEAFRAHSNAIQLLSSYYRRCSAVLCESSKPTDLSYLVCLHVAKFWTVAGQFESCRKLIPANLHNEICHVIFVSGKQTSMNALLLQSMKACQSIASHDDSVELFIPQKCKLWIELVRCLFKYDVTFKPFSIQSIESVEDGDRQEKSTPLMISDQMHINETAESAAHILFTKTFSNEFEKLIPFLHIFQTNCDALQFLHAFHANTRTPLFIWNETCRSELNNFITNENEAFDIFDFSGYSVLKNEPILNKIYINPFIEQPESLLDPSAHLFPYIFEWLQEEQNDEELLGLALTVLEIISARSQLSLSNAHVEQLSTLLQNNDCKHHDQICRIMTILCRYEGCIILLSNSRVPEIIIESMLKKDSNFKLQCSLMQILSSLIGIDNVKLVKQLYSLKAHLHLAFIICSGSQANIKLRVEAIDLLQKLLSDPLTGPRIRLELHRYLPDAVLDNMSDAKLTVHLLDSDHDNPEFSWSDKIREQVCSTLDQRRFDTLDGGDYNDKDTDDLLYQMTLYNQNDQLSVYGVRLEAFVNTPGYQVRFPAKFSKALLEELAIEIDKGQLLNLNILCESLLIVWQDNKHLLDSLPSTGYVQFLIRLLTSKQNEVYSTSFQLVSFAAMNFSCQVAFCEYDKELFTGFLNVMTIESKLRCCGADALLEMVSNSNMNLCQQFTKQIINTNLADFLLSTLCDEESTDQQFNARVVSIVKKMQEACPELVKPLCLKYPKWTHEYQPQKHDLFIDKMDVPTDRRTRLLGSSGTTFAGFLTDRSRPDSDVPPPTDQVDFS